MIRCDEFIAKLSWFQWHTKVKITYKHTLKGLVKWSEIHLVQLSCECPQEQKKSVQFYVGINSRKYRNSSVP